MASGNYTDFVLNDQYFHTGMIQGATQNLAAFNQASMGALVLQNIPLVGHYADKISYNTLEDAFTRRDITAATAITSTDTAFLTEANERSVKFNSKVYMAPTLGQFQKNFDPSVKGDYQEISYKIGQAFIVGRLKQQVNQAITVARAALAGQAASLYTVTTGDVSTQTMNSVSLNKGLALLGDFSQRVACLVMHSKAYRDLVGDQVASKIPGVADYNLFQGMPATYGLPTLVIDSPALVSTTGSGSTAVNTYYTLGLVQNAVEVTVSERDQMIVLPKLGYENLVMQMQGEGAHNLSVRGFAWHVATGINPTQAALATSTNWDTALSNVKLRAGFVIASK